MNIKDVKTWKGAVEFTAYKYSTVARRRALKNDCVFCRITNRRDEGCLGCPVHAQPCDCDIFWNRYLSRPRVHEIATAVRAKVKIFSAGNIRAALIKELKSRERERFLGE